MPDALPFKLSFDGISQEEMLFQQIKCIKQIADANRSSIGFITYGALLEAATKRRLLVADLDGKIVGFVHFRCCRDGHATIYEIAVLENYRRSGIGRQLINAVKMEAQLQGCNSLRLKCPVDLPANCFYEKIGFRKVRVEQGKKRKLNVWEIPLVANQNVSSFRFYICLTREWSEISKMTREFTSSFNDEPPFNFAQNVICAPVFMRSKVLEKMREWKHSNMFVKPDIVMFDSGGYQVQMGKISYKELIEKLKVVYENEQWADFYILPDNVPMTNDDIDTVERKINDTLKNGEVFIKLFPSLIDKFIGVVHGRTEKHIEYAVRKWHSIGIKYVAFGSFGTSGPNGSINMLSESSIRLLHSLATICESVGLSFHIFGIGHPNNLRRIKLSGIIPTSFDSISWWKAGAFGYVYVPQGGKVQSYSICRPEQMNISLQDFVVKLEQSGHSCPFCRNATLLREKRWNRILHNLVVMKESVDCLHKI